MFTRSWLTPNAIRDPHNPKASRSLCCPQGQSSCRHSSWAAGQALSGLVPLGQFPTSGAKLCIFHRGDLSPGGKQEQILSSAVSPAPRSSGAAVPVVWEGWEEGLALLRAGWSLQQHREFAAGWQCRGKLETLSAVLLLTRC